jgi:hypothetical protein
MDHLGSSLDARLRGRSRRHRVRHPDMQSGSHQGSLSGSMSSMTNPTPAAKQPTCAAGATGAGSPHCDMPVGRRLGVRCPEGTPAPSVDAISRRSSGFSEAWTSLIGRGSTGNPLIHQRPGGAPRRDLARSECGRASASYSGCLQTRTGTIVLTVRESPARSGSGWLVATNH